MAGHRRRPDRHAARCRERGLAAYGRKSNGRYDPRAWSTDARRILLGIVRPDRSAAADVGRPAIASRSRAPCSFIRRRSGDAPPISASIWSSSAATACCTVAGETSSRARRRRAPMQSTPPSPAPAAAAAAFAILAAFAMPASAAARLLRIGAGLHHAAGHDQGRGVFGAHLDLDDLALRHVEEEPVVGFGAQGRNTEMCSSCPGRLAASLDAWRLRDQHDRPHPRRREFDQADAAKARAVARRTASRTPASGRDRSRAPPACGRASSRRDRPAFARSDWRRGSRQRQRDHGDDQAGAGQPERQIGFRPIGDRNERAHQTVDPGHEPPGQIKVIATGRRPPGRSGNSCGNGPSARAGRPARIQPGARSEADRRGVIWVPDRGASRPYAS